MNRLVCIGWLGYKTCYLNVPKVQAIERWIREQGGDEATLFVEPDLIKEIEFDDEFGAYDVWR